jgi:hypothetical protein
MKLATIHDAQAINAILNHKDVRPYIWMGDHELKCEDNFDSCIWWLDDGGVVFFEPVGYEEYAIYLGWEKEKQGYPCLIRTRQALSHIFLEKDASRVYASINELNARSIRAAIALGFKVQPLAPGWMMASLDWFSFVDCSRYVDKLAKWINEEFGFIYNRPFAAACYMIKHGQADRALAEFNKYARLALYPPILQNENGEYIWDGNVLPIDDMIVTGG